MIKPAAPAHSGLNSGVVAEDIEPRILYSADAGAVGVGPVVDAVSADSRIEVQLLNTPDGLPSERTTPDAVLVVVDAGLPDLDTLLDEFDRRQSAGEALNYLLIGERDDGISLISGALQDTNREYDSVHILTHGGQGAFELGATTVDGDSLRARAAEFATWSTGLTSGADLNIYGCDLTSTDAGENLVAGLSALTGADVAASSDTTGHDSLGGNWVLEFQQGDIETALPVSPQFLSNWTTTLDVTITAPEQTVNETLPGRQETRDDDGGRQIASNGTDMVIVWENTDNKVIFFRLYNADGTPKTGANSGEQTIENTLSIQRNYPVVAMAANGDFIIAWESELQDGSADGIFAMRFDADGTPKARPSDAFVQPYSNAFEFRVNNTTAAEQQRPAVAMRDDGSFAIVWEAANVTPGFTSMELRHHAFNADGTRAGNSTDDFLFSDGLDLDQLRPAVAAGPSSSPFIVAFTSETAAGDQEIRIREVASNGSTSGATIIGQAGQVFASPQISMNASGNYAVVYENSAGGGVIDLMRYDSAGNSMDSGTAITVSETATGSQQRPSLGLNDDGRVLAVWEDEEATGGEDDIAIREVSAAGVALGSEVLVNSYTINHQYRPDIVFNGTQAAVVWDNHTASNAHDATLRMVTSFAPSVAPIGPVTDANAADNEILEDATPGALVGITAVATDPDPIDSVSYSLFSNPGSLFRVDSVSGVVTLNAGASLDREIAGTHSITIRALSTDGSSSDQNFDITVLDINDNAPAVSNTGLNVNENSPLNASVGFATSSDADTTGTAQNWLITGGTGNTAFEIIPGTGEVRVIDPGQLNHEPTPSLTLELTVSDGVNTSAPQLITISIDDQPEAPTGGASSVTALEDTDYPFVLGNFAFSDPDNLDQLTEIVIETLPGSGELVLNGSPLLVAGQTVDRAQLIAGALVYRPVPDLSGTGLTSFNVTVRDASGLPAAAQSVVTVSVTAVNDPPRITSDGGGATAAIGIAENTTAVTLVAAGDVDNGAPAYNIVGGNDAARFSIDAGGVLTLITPPDFESPSDVGLNNQYEVLVEARDAGGETDTQLITVAVSNQPEAPLGGASSVTATEDIDYPFDVTDFAFSDPDASDQLTEIVIESLPASGELVLNGSPLLVSGQTVDRTQLTAGALVYRPVPDLSGLSLTSFSVTVRDATGLSAPAQSVVTISVNAVNDPPQITSDGAGATASINIPENSTVVTTVVASDIDSGAPVYGIAGGNDASRFSMTTGGVLSMNTAPDFENPLDVDFNNQYEVLVEARDAGGEVDTQLITVNVTNQAESLAITAPASVSSIEDVVVNFGGAQIVSLSDPDLAGNLSVSLQVDAGALTLGQLNGLTLTTGDGVADSQVQFSGSLTDINAALLSMQYLPASNAHGAFNLNIDATDPLIPSRDAVASIAISVASVNDVPTTSGSQALAAQVGVSSPVDSSVLSATDVEDGAASLLYSFVELPAVGSLLFDGVAMTATDTFTEADLVAGRISYLTTTDGPTSTDEFVLIVTDANGGFSGNMTLSVQIGVPGFNPPDAGFGFSDNRSAGSAGQATQAGDDPVDEEQEESASYVNIPAGSDTLNQGNATASVISGGDAAGAGSSQFRDNADNRLVTGRRMLGASSNFEYERDRIADLPTRPMPTGSDQHGLGRQPVSEAAFLFSKDFERTTNSLQEHLTAAVRLDQRIVASTVAASTAMTVGYALWLIRGGALLSSVLASMPAWRSIDPLPILGSMGGAGSTDPDDESLEEILDKTGRAETAQSTPEAGVQNDASPATEPGA